MGPKDLVGALFSYVDKLAISPLRKGMLRGIILALVVFFWNVLVCAFFLALEYLQGPGGGDLCFLLGLLPAMVAGQPWSGLLGVMDKGSILELEFNLLISLLLNGFLLGVVLGIVGEWLSPRGSSGEKRL